MLTSLPIRVYSLIIHIVLMILVAYQEEVNRSISTFLISEDRGAMQGFAVGWHVAGELQACSTLMSAFGTFPKSHAPA